MSNKKKKKHWNKTTKIKTRRCGSKNPRNSSVPGVIQALPPPKTTELYACSNERGAKQLYKKHR